MRPRATLHRQLRRLALLAAAALAIRQLSHVVTQIGSGSSGSGGGGGGGGDSAQPQQLHHTAAEQQPQAAKQHDDDESEMPDPFLAAQQGIQYVGGDEPVEGVDGDGQSSGGDDGSGSGDGGTNSNDDGSNSGDGGTNSGGDGSSSGGTGTRSSGGAGWAATVEGEARRLTERLTEWTSHDGTLGFRAPQSRCAILRDGSVWPPPPEDSAGRLPFLFDSSRMTKWKEACGHCGTNEPLHCCGVCTFDRQRCNYLYRGQDKPGKVAAALRQAGYQLEAFTPCELFQRIRGRTLWFIGDSQMWALYYAAECFLREFAFSLRRQPAVLPAENQQLRMVEGHSPPLCLKLAYGTRVCGVRVDFVTEIHNKVLPRLARASRTFRRDIVVLNSGLHYPEYDRPGQPAARYTQQLAALAGWRALHAPLLPRLVWLDTAPQHFDTREGTFPGHGHRPFRCQPLEAWYSGDPDVAAGTRRGAAVAPLVPHLADAHLRVYNATVPFWDSHLPGECSHWCQPSAYQLWLLLLNGVLRDSKLGSPVVVHSK